MKITWKEWLEASNLPLTTRVVFHCRRGGVWRVFFGEKEIPVTREQRKFAREWIFRHKTKNFLVDPNMVDLFGKLKTGITRSDAYDMKKNVVIPVDFNNGIPVGHLPDNQHREARIMRGLSVSLKAVGISIEGADIRESLRRMNT